MAMASGLWWRRFDFLCNQPGQRVERQGDGCHHRSGGFHQSCVCRHGRFRKSDLTDSFIDGSPLNDGIVSGTKYACNLSPTEQAAVLQAGGRAGLPRFERVPAQPRLLQVEYLIRRDPAFHYTVEFSSDLIHWTPVNQAPTVTVIDHLWDRVLLRDEPAQADATTRYGRVRFTKE
jgi:hypothetical protein